MRAVGILVLTGIALSLQGCVAAVIPVVAGAAVTRTATDGKKHGDDERAQQKQEAAIEAQAKLSEMAAAPVPEVVVQLSPNAPDAFVEADAFSELIRYSAEQAEMGPQSGSLRSAMLKDPSTLRETRAECAVDIPTVLIDLDPDGGLFSADTGGKASPVLIEGLARLRDANVAIVWISGNSAAMAGDVRIALRNSGLDPNSADQLLLMRYPGDRKQTRRQNLAKSACIVAIAGDTRKDFDELFEYLVNREAALALELLIGQGWFLVPPAIAATEQQTLPPTDQRQTQ